MASIQQWNSYDFLNENLSHSLSGSDNMLKTSINSLFEHDLMNSSYSTGAEDAQSLPDASYYNRRHLQSFGSAFLEPPIATNSLPVTPTSLQPTLDFDPLQLGHLFKGSDALQRSSLSLDTPPSPKALPKNPFNFPHNFSHSQENFSSSTSSGANSPVSDSPVPTLENLLEIVNLMNVRNQQMAILRNSEAQNPLNMLLQLQQSGIDPVTHLNLLYANQLKNLQMVQNHSASSDHLLDYMAKNHRQSHAATENSFTWHGSLPTRNHDSITYSTKVFVGGIPWETTEGCLMEMFSQLGSVRIEWPGKENRTSRPRGCAYLIFEREEQVKELLSICQVHEDAGERKYFYRLLPKGKEVEVIPWIVSDSLYIKRTTLTLDPKMTVFVGALHGKLTAEGLAEIIDVLFGGVIYAAIDTDKHKYPMGAGRVTFDNAQSYVKAVRAAFVEIKTPKFKKKIQIDPYLEDNLCSSCNIQQGPYFCREIQCFKYYCRTCWQQRHFLVPLYYNHKPMSRNSKSQTLVGIGPPCSGSVYSGFQR
ncbi:cytoplasmic polyadenylation element-binding protein 1 [Phlebotomus argentipes]|uniref:cytoplasmic polyadenylation element-binding protein 1 n=1 Tax=Phlebotomus argentipes TaxID=94469 RepID=UPI002893350D|nr:cytoplasmic polyadenylation element-binding protein 1 [Phlebotomus argentipes]